MKKSGNSSETRTLSPAPLAITGHRPRPVDDGGTDVHPSPHHPREPCLVGKYLTLTPNPPSKIMKNLVGRDLSG
jgi:hypothetical protein